MIVKKRKGSMLLQTLVMAVIMAMIGVMILKWILMRYTLASRFYKSTVSKARVEGCLFYKVSNWGAWGTSKEIMTTPEGSDCSFNATSRESSTGKVNIDVDVISGTAVSFKIEQDDYY